MTSSNSSVSVKKPSDEISNVENLENDLLEENTNDILKAISKSQEEGQDEHEKKEKMQFQNQKKSKLKIKKKDGIVNTENNLKTNALNNTEDSYANNKISSSSSENVLATRSLQINYMDKASGPGIIFSKDHNTIYNFHERCPPVPYCEDFELVPQTRIFVYPMRYILNVYDETGELITDIIFNRPISRSHFLVVTILLFAVQLIVTFSFTFACVYIGSVGDFMVNNLATYISVFIVAVILFMIIIVYDKVRRKSPWNYITLAFFTFCSAYLVGYTYSEQEANTLIFSLIGTLLILFMICIIITLNCCDFTIYFFMIDTLFICMLIFYIGAAIYTNSTKSYIVKYVCFCFLTATMCLALLHQFELIFGRGKYSMKTNEDILSSIVAYAEIIIIFKIFPYLIDGPPS